MRKVLFKDVPLKKVFYTSEDKNQSEQWTKTDERAPNFNARHPGTELSRGFPGSAKFADDTEVWVDWLDDYFVDFRNLTAEQKAQLRAQHAEKVPVLADGQILKGSPEEGVS